MTSPWEHLHQYPPYYVRMLAKSGHAEALSDAEIAIASGMDINRVREIKMMTDWQNVTIGEAMRFTTACSFDPLRREDRDRARDYEYRCRMRNSVPFRYLRKSPKWESEFLPLLLLLQKRMLHGSSAA